MTLVCFLEEPSAENMLKEILPKILPEGVYYQCVVFEGKMDLEKNIQKRMQRYCVPDSVFLVMRDQDSGECKQIKSSLQEKVKASGKANKTIIRIACKELEAFFLGDLPAVEKGLKIKNLCTSCQNKTRYKNPDSIPSPAKELTRLTNKKYQKTSGSRAIAPLLELNGNNKSTSFNVLLTGIRNLVSSQMQL